MAFWTSDLERLVDFYVTYFGASAGAKYTNPAKGFESRFLTFADGARIEIMRTTQLQPVAIAAGAQRMGLTHLALSLVSPQQVDQLTCRLREDGYTVLDGPRRTGDGYYETVILDPDGNRLELAA